MARKSKSRSRRRARRARTGHAAGGLGLLVRSGWGRFAAGILIGLALGVGAAFYLGDFNLPLRDIGGAKVSTLNASPVPKPGQKQAAAVRAKPKPAPAPQIVEPAALASHAKPLGEEAKQ